MVLLIQLCIFTSLNKFSEDFSLKLNLSLHCLLSTAKELASSAAGYVWTTQPLYRAKVSEE